MPSKAELLELADSMEREFENAFNEFKKCAQADRLRHHVNRAAGILRARAEDQREGLAPEGSLKPARLLDGHNITIRARADENQRLHKPVGAPEIIAAIREEFGAGVSSRNVVLPELIHELGVFDVKLAFDAAFATIKVWVVQDASEPEPPKVETLHETKIRFRKRNAQGCSDIAADLCVIVLRCHLQLLDLLLHEQRRLGGGEWAQSELQRMRDEVDQMLEGSVE